MSDDTSTRSTDDTSTRSANDSIRNIEQYGGKSYKIKRIDPKTTTDEELQTELKAIQREIKLHK